MSSVADFGRNGKTSTHPELLDWLATELMDSGWNMKHLHRLMVTSQAYRQTSAFADSTQAQVLDPENQLLWRMNTGRMEAEVIRDSIIQLSGRLNQQMKGQELENDQALSTFRRSIYYSIYPEDGGKSKFAELFDAPDSLDCYRRTRTIIPQQALALTNSEIIHQAASSMEKEIWAQVFEATSHDERNDAFIPTEDFDLFLKEFQSVFPLRNPWNDIIEDEFDKTGHNFFDHKTIRLIVEKIKLIENENEKENAFLLETINWLNDKLVYAEYIVVYGNL